MTTYALFEDAGDVLSGRLLELAQASAQIELVSGKRQKVKLSHILLRFDKPEPEALLQAARAESQTIDLALAWEFAPEGEFGFAALAAEYFSSHPSLVEQTAMLLALQGAPHYFRRAGNKGFYKKADAATLALALAAIEKKKAVLAQIEAWSEQLVQKQCPPPIAQQLYKILFQPDKNAPEYKAVVQAARQANLQPLALLQAAGVIANPYQFHWQRFLYQGLPAKHSAQAANIANAFRFAPLTDLPLATVRAFSIDDSATTEIDDALSVTFLPEEQHVVLGIHIAAPSLGITAGDVLDQWARARLSTVYVPGQKITMLPDAVVEPFSLNASNQEQDARPVVSLYVRFDAATLDVVSEETKLERLLIWANLRYDRIDHIVNAAWLTEAPETSETSEAVEITQATGSTQATQSANAAETTDLANIRQAGEVRRELSWLYQLALHLKTQREAVRGKPETFNRPDYSFKLEPTKNDTPGANIKSADTKGAEIQGDERVHIVPRVRGAPLDLIVAECMIVANSRWGAWLAQLGVPMIYRSQASLDFGVKVRMSTKALPHAGIGVSCYAWCTSPLRRYTDLVNQWQIVAAVKYGATAGLAAPFKPKDAALFAIIASFEDAHANYGRVQQTMERYWTLQYICQNHVQEMTGTVLKDGLVRADDLPLVLPVMGAATLPRGAHIRFKLGAADLIALEINGTLIERLDATPTAGDEQPAGAEPDADADTDAELLLPAVSVAIDMQAQEDGEQSQTTYSTHPTNNEAKNQEQKGEAGA